MFGATLHWTLLASFAWTAVEGLRLCHLVFDVFAQQRRDWTRRYAALAYGGAGLTVAVTAVVAQLSHAGGVVGAYAGDESCWLAGGSYTWAFAGPVAAVLLVAYFFWFVFRFRLMAFRTVGGPNLLLQTNVGTIVVAVHWSWRLKKNELRALVDKVRSAARMCLSLTGLLGISWLTGFLLYVDSDVLAFVFTITNGLQVPPSVVLTLKPGPPPRRPPSARPSDVEPLDLDLNPSLNLQLTLQLALVLALNLCI